MSWHVDPARLADYVRGDTDPAHSFSIEAHVPTCPDCRARIAALSDRDRLDRLWHGVEDRIGAPRQSPVEAMLVRVGTPHHVARLLAATPSLTASWLAAISLCLAFAVIGAHLSRHGLLVFLTLAPMLPVAGVAAAYGRAVDPTYEIGLASPTSGFRLLLVRAATVLTVTTVLAGVAALALPDVGWLAAAWLLPSLALTLSGLALATYLPSAVAFGTVALAWAGAIILGSLSDDGFALFDGTAQLGFLIVAVLAGSVLERRREVFERERPA